MRNREILRLVAGFRRFRDKYFSESETTSSKIFESQNPKTLIIGCSDSRVDPALISSSSPGELFIVRNVANLVPPYETAATGRHGVSAAIEFAVVNLKVENIVILGHRRCGGIRALMEGSQQKQNSFVGMWMEIAERAKLKVLTKFKNQDFEIQCLECEKEGIVTSMENLKTFPFVQDAITLRDLKIFGIYFDLDQGILLEYEESIDGFQPVKMGRESLDLRDEDIQ